MADMTIIIGGDLAPVGADGGLFAKGQTERVVDPALLALLQESDYTVFNMEGPFLDEGVPIQKDGPHLSFKEEAVKGLKALHISLLTLANNHSMDYGAKGLSRTRELLDEQGIAYIGAGDTLKEAGKPHIFEKEGRKVGVYACADREFSIAGENTPGANPYSVPESLAQINALKEQCGYVIVLYHGGRELYRYPSPGLQKMCRQMADAGADVILCQHSHCLGAKEEYKGAHILYGQGNFVFGEPEDALCVHSVLVKIEAGDALRVAYVPFAREGGKLSPMPQEKEQSVMESFQERSRQIVQPGFVEHQYEQLARAASMGYLYQMAGWPLFFIRLDKLFGRRLICWSFRRKKKRLLCLLNMLRCDAHRELIEKGLETLL